jgi:hypothetical protein
MTPQEAAFALKNATGRACEKINDFSQSVFRTRGGRLGSGMGILLEALWGYYINVELENEAALCEVGWVPGHEYNDFACVQRDQEWIPSSRTGELLRVEAKSMNTEADESKGHFDELISRLGVWDLLLVLAWSWNLAGDGIRLYPHIHDYFIDSARSIALLRDGLHLARKGSFVDRSNCPDHCLPELCKHHGEPLNSAGKRERRSGPISCRPEDSSYAANFGGLVRMVKTRGQAARGVLTDACATDPVAEAYVAFIHRNFPSRLKTIENEE